jgi:hypothetical protein
MATEKQIEANRRNAQKSSGPRTDSGKQASPLNGMSPVSPSIEAAASAQGGKGSRGCSSRNSFKLGIHISDATLFDDPESAADLERT